MKKYIETPYQLYEVIHEYLPSKIWLDGFSEDTPYIQGTYSDNKFHGTYVGQTLLTFDINSQTQIEKIFEQGMYIII